MLRIIILLFFTSQVYAQPTSIIIAVQQQGGGGTTPPASGDWFVKTTGNDSNPGTDASPFLTIGKAESVSSDGDVITVFNGSYRETLVIDVPNLTIQNASGNHSVYISGAEDFGTGGWTNDGGNVYYKSITMPLDGQYATSISSNTTLLNNQVWENGVEKIMGRYPDLPAGNTTEDLFNRAYMDDTFTTLNGTTLTDPTLPAITVVTNTFLVGMGWFVATGSNVNSRTGTTLSISGNGGGDDFNRRYALYAARELITQEGEWFYNASTDRFYYQTSGGTPTNLQYKARNYGIRPNASGITIRGIRLFGCGVDGTGANFTYDGRPSESSDTTAYSTVYYPYHGLKVGNQNSGLDVYSGFRVTGGGAEYRNLFIKYSSGTMIYAYDDDHIHNNHAEYGSYAGNYGAFVRPSVGADRITIEKNTALYFGRSIVDFGYQDHDTHADMIIRLNDFGHGMMLSFDGANLYGGIYIDLDGSRISYNFLHHAQALVEGSGGDKGWNGSGYYADQLVGGQDVTVDHNIILGVSGSYENGNIFHQRDVTVPRTSFYYNTLLGGSTGAYTSYVPNGEMFDNLKSNIFRSSLQLCNGNPLCNPGLTSPYYAGNVASGTNPLFVGGFTSEDPRQYQLQSGSPARGAGVAITGISSSTDAGAYPYGGFVWRPGCGF